MTGTRHDIAKAEATAAAARDDMSRTLARLKGRLSPAVRARETWEDMRDRGEGYADDALEFAYERPNAVMSAGGVVLLLLLRRPIYRALRRIFSRRSRWDTASAVGAANKSLTRPVAKLPANGGEKR